MTMNTLVRKITQTKIYETRTTRSDKTGFEDRLAAALNLKRVTAPLF